MIKELNYDLTKDDFKKVSKDLLKIYKKVRIKFALLYSIFISFMSIIIFFLISIIQNYKYILLNISGVIYTFLVCYILIYCLYPKRLAKDMIKISEEELLNNKMIKINSENDYFITNSNNVETKCIWKVIKEIYSLENSIFLFITKYRMVFIPKRIFSSEEEMNETWALIQECYNKSR